MNSPLSSELNKELNSELPIRDIHLPDSVDWWPIAPGWWLLFLISLLAILLVYRNIKTHPDSNIPSSQNTYKTISNAQTLLKKINRIPNDKQAIIKISVLLRRTAMSLYEDENIAGLTGSKWLSFLDEKGKTTDFSQGGGQVLLQQPYNKLTPYNRPQLVAITKRWLQTQAGLHGA